MFRELWTVFGTRQIWMTVLAASAGIAVADEEPSAVLIDAQGAIVTEVQPVAHETTTEIVSADAACCPRRGWYLSASGAWQHRSTAREVGDPTTFLIFDEGFGVNGALGYRFGRIRVEGEYSFANNEVDIAGAAGNQSPGPGNVNLYILMANVAYDLPIGDTPWRVYLGGGIGAFQSELNSLRPDFFAAVPAAFGGPFAPLNTRSNFPFAFQLRTGLGYQLSERTETFVGYRYFDGEKLTFSSVPFNTFKPNGALNHMIEWGFRIAF